MTLRLEYVGFVDTSVGREYSLRTQDGTGEPKAFVLVIENAAFASRTTRYQDGPDICYQKLLAVLSSPPVQHQRITLSEEDLVQYRHVHAPRPSRQRTTPFDAAASEPSPLKN